MAGEWKEVVRLRFKGRRFRDHALDLSALAELSQFQKVVAETAKALWRGANPDRKNLPPRFEERTRLCLRSIDEGSAVVPLEVFVEQPQHPEFWEKEPVEVNDAIALAHEVFRAVERNDPLPERLPKQLVSEYAKWGQSLADDEEVEFSPPGKPPARLIPQFRERLAAFAESPYEDAAEVSGEVFAADVRQKRFQLWCDDETPASVVFDERQEELVTTALRDHKRVRLRVKGRGEFSPFGRLQRISHVESLHLIHPEAGDYDADTPLVEDVLRTIAADVPPEEWDRLPSDLTDDLDHYLYGTAKR